MNKKTELNQYSTAENLNARVKLHEKYSTNKIGFHEWVFSKMDVRENMRILECGCGPGLLWKKNKDKIPDNCEIVLLDMSEGMLAEAEENIGVISGAKFSYIRGDIQDIPFACNSFDVVIANHMLYHVPDINLALTETKRVLKQSGMFYASTFGLDHLKELDQLTRRFVCIDGNRKSDRFTLENGYEVIAKVYGSVHIIRHDDSLVVTEAQDLIDYILSGSKAQEQLVGEKRIVFENEIKGMFPTLFKIRKDAGVFIAKKE